MIRNILLILVLSLIVTKGVIAQGVDRYAKIATQLYDTREHLLEEQKPLQLTNKYLPTNHKADSDFRSVKTQHSDAELDSLLQEMRLKYIPFMQKLAPEYKLYRKKLMLDRFNWKVKDEEQSFESVLKGEGDWQEVKIPHYGEPLGKSTTFYFKDFELNDEWFDDNSLYLCFKGVDYKAHVFVNGAFVGSHEGFFAPFEFNISKVAQKGKNRILVQVENDFPMHGLTDKNGNKIVGDKVYAATGPGYDEPKLGWHHCPPAMGIYQDCYIESRGKLHINDIFIRPLPNEKSAEAWIEVNNDFNLPKNIKLTVSLFGQNFTDTVFQALEYSPYTRNVKGFGDLDRPTDGDKVDLPMIPGYVNYFRININMGDFKTWEPDSPWLYEMQIAVKDEEGFVYDIQSQEFGMRTFTMDTVSEPKGMMYLNGNKIRLRGANTMGHLQNCVMKKDWEQLTDDILLAKIANMNYLRFTQRPVQKEIYEYCDMLGLLNQTDLPLFGILTRNQFAETLKQAEEMERLVRNHPSAIMVTYINERSPNSAGFPQRGFGEAKDFDKVFKAFDQAVLLNNPDRIIKASDGDYDPPGPGLPDNHCYNFWYNGHGLGVGKMHRGYWMSVKPGWYYGCGEFGAEGLDRVELMEKYYPKEWLPKDDADEKNWNANRISKAQTQRFHHMWYNTQNSLNDWVRASQTHQEWAVKLTTEAFRRDPRMVSFAVHLFIDAWPGGWMKTIMDVDRNPKKAYWAYKEALKPIIVSLRTDRDKYFSGDSVKIETWICNDKNKSPENYTLKYKLVKGDKTLFTNSTAPEIPVNSSQFNGFIAFEAPKPEERTTYTVVLSLFDHHNVPVDQSELDFEVFPEFKPANQKISIVGAKNGVAASICSDLDCRKTNKIGMNTIIIEDYKSYIEDSVAINQAVLRGAKAIFLELAPGIYSIANSEITVSPTEMGEYFFVSPHTGHTLMDEFRPFDFRFWYDPSVDYIAPILSNFFSGKNWKPILSSGELNWYEEGGKVLAAGELKYGNGSFMVCQLKIAGRLQTNPTAKLFVGKLLN